MSQHLLLESELTGNLQQDRTKILDALKSGQFYLCLDLLGDPRGFYNYMYNRDTRYMMGSEIKWKPGLSLKIHLPDKPKVFFEVVVYRNGTRYKTVNASDVEVPIEEPGIYRVQVRIAQRFPLPDAIKWISWIYGNPYFVR